MTPEEIVKDLIEGIESGKTYSSAANAAQAIKDYARKMCDKQKELCIEDWNDTEEGDVLRDYSAIKNAPYPKELQQ